MAYGTAKSIGVASMGVMRPKLVMKSAAVGTHEVAARVLVLLLSVQSNCKEFTREENNVLKLVQMLDPRRNGGRFAEAGADLLFFPFYSLFDCLGLFCGILSSILFGYKIQRKQRYFVMKVEMK